jgi:CDP-paratose 2-epimerase
LHGFLAYLARAVREGRTYRIFGYKGKQVRDNIHASDVVEAFLQFWSAPRSGGCVYNLGGGRESHCSMLEAIELCQRIAGRRLAWTYCDRNRIGDHIWYVSSLHRFQADFPEWRRRYGLEALLQDIYDQNIEPWERGELEDTTRLVPLAAGRVN